MSASRPTAHSTSCPHSPPELICCLDCSTPSTSLCVACLLHHLPIVFPIRFAPWRKPSDTDQPHLWQREPAQPDPVLLHLLCHSGERVQARGGPIGGKVHLSLLVLFPDTAQHLASYFNGQLWPPLALLAQGAGAPALLLTPTTLAGPGLPLLSLSEAVVGAGGSSAGKRAGLVGGAANSDAEAERAHVHARDKAAAVAAAGREEMVHPEVDETVLVRKRCKVVFG